MTRKLEIAFTVVLIIFALLFLVIGTYAVHTTLELRDEYMKSYGSELGVDFSLTTLFKRVHLLFLIGIIQLAGGLLLFLEKKEGWLLSTIGALGGSVYLGHSFYYVAKIYNKGYLFENDDPLYLWLGLFIWMSSMFIGLMLITTWFKQKYDPTKNAALSIALAIVIISIDLIYVVYSL